MMKNGSKVIQNETTQIKVIDKIDSMINLPKIHRTEFSQLPLNTFQS
jgi:hypothetical protein